MSMFAKIYRLIYMELYTDMFVMIIKVYCPKKR